jgi:hypothetical protein
MTKTKYFVIRYDANDASIYRDADTLNDAREEAERYAMDYPGVRFLIAVEVQSVVVQTQVKWTDK